MIDSLYSDLLLTLQTTLDISEIQQAHETFLNKLEKKCFLSSPIVLEKLGLALKACDELCDGFYQESLFKGTDRDLDVLARVSFTNCLKKM